MKRIIGNEKKCKDNRILLVVMICVFFSVLSFFFSHIYYRSSDDRIMNQIAAGAFGTENSVYLIYQNAVIGLYLKLLFSILPGINWYLINLYFFGLLSVISLCIVFTDETNVICSVLITLVINTFISEYLYKGIQFTISACIYTVSGFFFFFTVFYKQRINYVRLVLGSVLIIWGMMTRIESFLQVIPFSIVTFLAYSYLVYNKSFVDFFKEKANIIIFFFLASALLLVFIINLSFYKGSKWDYYKEYNRYSAIITNSGEDYGIPDYYDDVEGYERIGFSETDVYLVKNWHRLGKDRFNPQRLKSVSELRRKNGRSSIFYARLFKKSVNRIIRIIQIPLMLVTSIVFLCMLGKRTKKGYLFFLFASILVVILEQTYLSYFDRELFRVEFGIAYAFIAFELYVIKMLYIRGRVIIIKEPYIFYMIKKRMDYLLMIASIGLVLTNFASWQYEFSVFKKTSFQERDSGFITALFDLHNRDGSYYYIDPVILETYGIDSRDDNLYAINAKRYSDLYSNMIYTGGWTVPSPLNDRFLDSKNKDIEGLIDDDAFYVVDEYSNREKYVCLLLTEIMDRDVKMRINKSEYQHIKIVKYYVEG